MSVIWDVLVGYFKGSKQCLDRPRGGKVNLLCVPPLTRSGTRQRTHWWWDPLCGLLHLTKPYQTYLCFSCEVLLSRKTKENLFVRPHGYLVHLNWRHTTQTAENKDNWGQQLKADWHIWVCLWAPWTKPYRKMLFAVIKVFSSSFFSLLRLQTLGQNIAKVLLSCSPWCINIIFWKVFCFTFYVRSLINGTRCSTGVGHFLQRGQNPGFVPFHSFLLLLKCIPLMFTTI